MKKTLLALSCSLALISSPLFAAEDTLLGTLNGNPIHQSDLDKFQSERQNVQQRAIPAERLFEEYVNYQLIMEQAAKNKVPESPTFQEELNQFRNQLLLQHTLKQYLEANPVDEEEVKKIYEEQKARAITTEFHARHILVPEEEAAKKLITELDGGADFAALAKEHSTGPTGKNGGDLGWFSAKQMVAPFSEAVATMEPGTYSKAPVQTQFGWHVIKLEEKRQSEPPTLEQLRSRIEQAIQQANLQKYIQSLISAAKIVKN
jgi:peptidyl-prolyl cis-trans isomerase C